MRLRTVVAPIEHHRQSASLVARNGTHDRTAARARRALGEILLWRKGAICDCGGPLGPTLRLAALSLAGGRVADTVGFDGASKVVGLGLCGVEQAVKG